MADSGLPPPVPVSLSHFGLFVCDVETMAAFYRDVMGFAVTDRGPLAGAEIAFLSRDPREHHQIVLVAGRPDAPAQQVVNQLSFRVGSLADLKAFHGRLALTCATDVQPVTHGIAWSVYFRDPEGNRIEVFADADWYIPQPCRIPIDLARPVEEIYADTKAFCEAQEGWRPFADWQADLARRIRPEA